jgi:hypothetical protein
MTMSNPRPQTRAPTQREVTSRIAASLLGSFGFVWGFVTSTVVLGVGAGMSFEDAQALAYLLAFLLFAACFCWAFAAGSAVRVWLVLVGGGAVMSGLGWLGARALM